MINDYLIIYVRPEKDSIMAFENIAAQRVVPSWFFFFWDGLIILSQKINYM